MTRDARETWATRTGFVLAAVGSAVGLGNVWRFPWMTAENGGSAFLGVYLGVVLLVGVPGLLGEFVVGRRGRRNPVGSLRALSGSRAWGGVGAVAVLAAVVLLTFYSVVGGWILRYAAESAVGVVAGTPAFVAAPGAFFGQVSHGPAAVGAHLVFLAVTATVVVGGVRRGIERAATVMTPTVVVLLAALAAWAAAQPGTAAGYEFYLAPDFAVLRSDPLGVLVPAAGQALFTLSIGAGTMLTYASYLGEERSLPADATVIAVLNTLVGVLAGLAVFPLLYSGGLDPGTGGPGALFVGLATAFGRLPAGEVLAFALFAAVALAALTSAVSILEIPVAVLTDEVGLGRRRAVASLVVFYGVTGSAAALSPDLFSLLAGPVVDVLLAVGLFAVLVFAGWTLGPDAVAEFRRGAGPVASALATAWRATVAVPVPAFLAFSTLSALGAERAFGAGATVALALAVVGLAVAGARAGAGRALDGRPE
jgi:NSS family neurotransmitter:Na+ symporter